MKMDQIAFYAVDEKQKDDIKTWFDLTDKKWIVDTVTCVSDVWLDGGYNQIENVAELNFNYDLGTEFEILRFVKGPSWHARMSVARPFISHIGIHLDDGDPWPWQKQIADHGAPAGKNDFTFVPVGSIVSGIGKLVQRTKTISHTAWHFNNPDSPAYGRKYEYEIYEIGTGAFIKYIRRIYPEKQAG